MKLFLMNFGISLLGAWIFLLLRAVLHAKSLFSLLKFIRENHIRWVLIFFILLILQLLLLIEGEAILSILINFGLVMPVISNAVIGFSISWLTIKLSKKKKL
jgi:hypothetical protein